jgi:hypothetical protein
MRHILALSAGLGCTDRPGYRSERGLCRGVSSGSHPPGSADPPEDAIRLIEPDVSAMPGSRPDAPLLTVLIPSWNAASSIERALASILEERRIPLECVVIDDASTDGTADVVQAVADRDPRVVLIRLPSNMGVSNARNRGLAVARGVWLSFLDADDRLLPGAIDALMRPTVDPEVLVVVGQRIWTDGDRTWISPVYDNRDIREPGRKSIATHPGLLYYASSTGKVIHRSLTEDLQFEGRVLGDQLWAVRAMLRAGGGIEVIGETIYEWSRPHPDRYVPTITAATRASAERAAEMAAMAPSVFAGVSAEVDAQIEDEPMRHAVKLAYFERLVRSDLSAPVKSALERRDPATGELYAAVAAFLETVPAPILASSDRLVRQILWPPLRRRRSLAPAARPSYRRMVRARVRADQATRYRFGGPLRVPARVIARVLGDPLGTTAASALLATVPLGRAVLGRLRRA